MDNLIWYVKQLLPLKYHTTYTEAATGQRMITVWRMWLGRHFWVQEWVLQGPDSVDNTARRIVDQLLDYFGIEGDVDLVNYIKARVN